MQIVYLCLFGAVCLIGGYLAGAARAHLMHMKTVKLLDKLDRTMAEYNSLRDDILLMIESGEQIK